MRKRPEVNMAVVSLSKTQPSRPIEPPPQPSGAMVIQTAEMAIKIIANFFQALNISSLRKSNMNEIIAITAEKKKPGNKIPSPTN